MTALATHSPRRLFAQIPAQALLVLLAGGALLWLVTQVPQRTWQPKPAVEVALAGEHYRVAPEELRWLESFSTLHFSEGEEAARDIVAAQLDAQLERIFSHAEKQLPEFADWYYSLRGEYSRAAMAALSYANLADPGYVANRAASMLLPEDVRGGDLEALRRETAASLQAHQMEVRAGWLVEVTRRLSPYRVPAPLNSEAEAAGERRVVLDELIQEILSRESTAFNQRLSLSTFAAGGAAAGPALWRAATARSSALAGRTAAVRAATRGAARVGPAAAGGAAVCSPAGPAAFGCALFAGAAVWLATDWALLQVDEHLHREELVAALDAGLVDLRREIEQDLLAAYDEMIAGHYAAVRQDIHRSFVPARAGDGAATQPSQTP